MELSVVEEFDRQRDYRLRLFATGYLRPLSLVNKAPWMKGWQTSKIDGDVIQSWDTYAYGNINRPAISTGIQPATNGHNMVWIDCDVSDALTAEYAREAVRQIFGEVAYADMPYRHSQRHTFALLARTDKPFPYRTSGTFIDPEGESHKVEVFGEAVMKQMAVFGPHTTEKVNGVIQYRNGKMLVSRMYEWANRSPLDVPPEKLPLIKTDDLHWFLKTMDAAMSDTPRYTQKKVKVYDGNRTEGYSITDKSVFQTENFGDISRAELLYKLISVGDVRCSLSFTDPIYKNRTKGLASLLPDGGVMVYDFEEGISHYDECRDPDLLNRARFHIHKRRVKPNG